MKRPKRRKVKPEPEADNQLVTTISYNQHDIIRNIQRLYVPDGFECDPTFSKGVFYKPDDIPTPELKSDLHPLDDTILQATAENLPYESQSIQSIMFDPPFLVGFTKGSPDGTGKITGHMGSRFKGFRTVPDLWDWYELCLVEMFRLLKPGGFLVFKCQDIVASHLNWFTHSFVINKAVDVGFYTRDMFVLLATHRMIGHNHKVQQHARKFHSYFLVFQKKTNSMKKHFQRWDYHEKT